MTGPHDECAPAGVPTRFVRSSRFVGPFGHAMAPDGPASLTPERVAELMGDGAASVALSCALARRFGELYPLFVDHYELNDGAVLGYVFLGDVAARLVRDGERSDRVVLREVLGWLEEQVEAAPDLYASCVAVGFLEGLAWWPGGDDEWARQEIPDGLVPLL